MTDVHQLSKQQLREYEKIVELRRECLIKEVEQLSGVLHGLTTSYRTLVDAAEEFNRISFSSKNDVSDAVKRADYLGNLIDDIISTLDYKLKIYLKDIKKLDLCTEDYLYSCLEAKSIENDDFLEP